MRANWSQVNDAFVDLSNIFSGQVVSEWVCGLNHVLEIMIMVMMSDWIEREMINDFIQWGWLLDQLMNEWTNEWQKIFKEHDDLDCQSVDRLFTLLSANTHKPERKEESSLHVYLHKHFSHRRLIEWRFLSMMQRGETCLYIGMKAYLSATLQPPAAIVVCSIELHVHPSFFSLVHTDVVYLLR